MKFSEKLFKLNFRSFLALSHDFIFCIFAWILSFHLRFNFSIPNTNIYSLINNLPIVVFLQIFIFILIGLYRGTWRFASLIDFKRIFIATFFSSTLLLPVLFYTSGYEDIPRSVLILDPLLVLIFMGGNRLLYRYFKEQKIYNLIFDNRNPIIIIGLESFANILIKDLNQNTRWNVVGVFGYEKNIFGREIAGVNVYKSLDALPDLVKSKHVSHAILALPFEMQNEKRKALYKAKENGLEVLTIPPINDLISGNTTLSQIRPIDLEDLLGRSPVKLNSKGINNLISNHVIFVSGAGGSIGSELCKQIIKYKPRRLVCFDISEFSLYKLEQLIKEEGCSADIDYIVGDSKNLSRLRYLFKTYKPKIIFHAAAYKHVPLMEHKNVKEALINNVLGTYLTLTAAKKSKVEKFILVSTDKAVNPTNVMGASKRISEMICQGMQDKNETKVSVVRFGNVLGSSGSVIPKFHEQIKNGGPVTVTHPEITRYFMSIPEAAQLLLQAALMSSGGEIFVMDMGKPVKIIDLAKDMIKLSGLKEDEIHIKFSGLRSGEKLYEELLLEEELVKETTHEKLRIASAKPVKKYWINSLINWINNIEDENEEKIKKDIKTWVPEYNPDLNK